MRKGIGLDFRNITGERNYDTTKTFTKQNIAQRENWWWKKMELRECGLRA